MYCSHMTHDDIPVSHTCSYQYRYSNALGCVESDCMFGEGVLNQNNRGILLLLSVCRRAPQSPPGMTSFSCPLKKLLTRLASGRLASCTLCHCSKLSNATTVGKFNLSRSFPSPPPLHYLSCAPGTTYINFSDC